MRTEWWKTLLWVCLITAATGWGTTLAADVKESNAVSTQKQQPSEWAMEEEQPGPKQIERMLARIRETDPEKADELARLQKENPDVFRTELRKVMRERFMNRMKEQKGEMGKWQPGPEGQMPEMPGPGECPQVGPGMMPPGQGPGMMWEWMKEKHEEYMKWLKESYPDEAAKLEQLKTENPKQYMRAMAINGKKYGRIFEASRNNPQLATVLKEQMTLKEKRAELLRQIKATTDEKQKKELTGELETLVSQQFDLIVKRKQMAYEDLTKKLAELQKEVDQRKTEAEKWKNADFKNEQVKQRVSKLLTETEKFEWE